MRTFLLPAVCCMTLIALCGCAPMKKPAMTISWDLSKSHTTADVQWAGEPDRRYWKIDKFFDGGIDLTLKLPNGLAFAGVISNVSLMREPEEWDFVKEISFVTFWMTTDEAYQYADRYIKEWGLLRGKLDQWLVQARQLGHEGEIFVTQGCTEDISLILEIRRSYDRKKPWVVIITILWWVPTRLSCQDRVLTNDNRVGGQLLTNDKSA
jgi:hypothetical protein